MSISEFLIPDWPAPMTVKALVTTRRLPGASLAPYDAFNLGAHCGDVETAVLSNRQALVSLASLPSSPHWLRQVHGIAVHRVTGVTPLESEPEADASVTAEKNQVLVALTADCLPVFFAAKNGSEVAVAHAGWRGLVKGVLEATVANMTTSPSQLMAWLGPAAGPNNYEVGEEVYQAFVTDDAAALSCFTSTRPGHFLIDLYALAKLRLRSAGVTSIYGGGLCTIADPARFYSYRRDQVTGRLASLIYLTE